MQKSIIDLLPPFERALLYTALMSFKEQAEKGLSANLIHGTDNMLKKFFGDTVTDCKAVANKVFGDCLPEDLDYMDHYTKKNNVSALNPKEETKVMA